MHLRSLTGEELIALVRTKPDATPLEQELARRLAAMNDELDEMEKEMRDMRETHE